MPSPTPRPDSSRRRRRIGILAAAAAASTLILTACSGSNGRLLVVADTTGVDATTASTDVWAVDPGEQPSSTNRVASEVTRPLSINVVNDDGTMARDTLGTAWSNATLLSFQDLRGRSLTTVGHPGSRSTTISADNGPLQTSILRRGVFVATQDRCVLARSEAETERVGSGLCQVSEDERWVVAWPAQGGRLSIRDLRTGKVRTVGGTTADAVALGRGTSVLAVQETAGGKQGIVVDATTGKVTGRTPVFQEMRAIPVTAESTGFTALAVGSLGASPTDADAAAGETQLLWIDTSAKVQVVDRGALMLPLHTDTAVTYVRLGNAQAGSDSIRRWDSSSGSRTVLLSGRVGAAAAGADGIVATRDTEHGVELYRSNTHGTLDHVTTLRVDASQGSNVGRVLTSGDATWMEISVGGTMAIARIDLVGNDSAVPIRGWAQLSLGGLDADGTALITGYRTTQSQHLTVGVVTPSGNRYAERITANADGLNLIHDGVIYVTDRADDGTLRVRSVRAQGRPAPTLLYRGLSVGGATWPTDNGATVSTLISRQAVMQAQRPASSSGAGSSDAGSSDAGSSGTP
ncbi:MAG: hypothetical protein JST64_06420 [Actinobacteria bacterium]|nr:hypothetical protein [Actinomycetota bacterium]